MEKITIYQKPTCSTCKQIYQAIEESGIDFESIDYYTTRISNEKIKELVHKIGIPMKDILRKKEDIYEQLRIGEKDFSDDQIIELIGVYPDLLVRPIVEKGEKAIIAKPISKIKAFLQEEAANPEQDEITPS